MICGNAMTRLRVRVRGTVQGVGFRPHVWRLARGLGLTGTVLNDAEGVLAEVQGHRAAEFVPTLRAGPPPLARITAIEVAPIPPLPGEAAFVILASAGGRVATSVAPDACVCPACLAEMSDPADRRWRYPFLNCTECGPRFTITRRLPYDRANTAMAGFPLCPDCAGEYADPADRRFHAEPIACPRCGPQLSHPIEAVLAALRAGRIVALKGLGGFHLLCDATDADAVDRLRAAQGAGRQAVRGDGAERRQRRTVDHHPTRRSGPRWNRSSARSCCCANAPACPRRWRRGWIRSASCCRRRRSITCCSTKRPAGPLGTAWLAALSALLLVATSANPGGEPLVIDDAEAAARLAGIADLVVTHDRAVVTRCDDSVVRVIDGAPRFLRRARGYTPRAIPLPRPVRRCWRWAAC